MATVRCENCGTENPEGALVCRTCRQRLRRRGAAVAGPRRETEAELTGVVTRELSRLLGFIAVILALGLVAAVPVYRRVEPVLVVLVVAAAVLALVTRRQAGRTA